MGVIVVQSGYTALMDAGRNNNADIVESLLKAGAVINIKNKVCADIFANSFSSSSSSAHTSVCCLFVLHPKF